MIRWALADSFRPLMSIALARSPSISSQSTFGSTTTPLPITHSLPGYRMPDGIRWNLNVSPLRTIVWPALLPPWKRTTASACSASRSVIFPLPSSPHWAPTITMPDIARGSLGRVLEDLPAILAQQRDRLAHLSQPRNGALGDLLDELLVREVGGDHHRALRLVAGVDDRVE